MTTGIDPLVEKWAVSDILDNGTLGIVTDCGPQGPCSILIGAYNRIHQEVLYRIVADHNSQLAGRGTDAGKGDA